MKKTYGTGNSSVFNMADMTEQKCRRFCANSHDACIQCHLTQSNIWHYAFAWHNAGGERWNRFLIWNFQDVDDVLQMEWIESVLKIVYFSVREYLAKFICLTSIDGWSLKNNNLLHSLHGIVKPPEKHIEKPLKDKFNWNDICPSRQLF